MKLGRKYKLMIQADDGSTLIIQPPTTIQFTIVRDTSATVNTMMLQIYNLSLSTRNSIFKDRFAGFIYRRIVLQAGYDELSTIFIGDILESNSARSGTDMITTISARDGGHDVTDTQISLTFDTGGATSVRDLITLLSNKFPRVVAGKIGTIDGAFLRPVTVHGNLYNIIKQYSNNQCFIDLGVINTIAPYEAFHAVQPLITAETGLLNTPKRDSAWMQIDTLFEPKIVMGQVVKLESETLPNYNGSYKVNSVTHRGVISEAIGGTCTSTFGLFDPSKVFSKLSIVA